MMSPIIATQYTALKVLIKLCTNTVNLIKTNVFFYEIKKNNTAMINVEYLITHSYVKTLRCREYLFIFLKITAKGWYSGHQHARQVRQHNATVDLQLEEARQSLA